MTGFFTERTVSWEGDHVDMIDQTALPTRFRRVRIADAEAMAGAIRTMVVRGAPAIGVAAAMGVALEAVRSDGRDLEATIRRLRAAGALLKATRPTAVNLFWGVDRVLAAAERGSTASGAREAAVAEVRKMAEEDVEANHRLGRFGADLVDDGDTVLTQCNAGALATVGYGTALGVVRAAKEQGKLVKVLVPETRPALQGARLTAFELVTDDIDCRLIPDTAVGYMMARGTVDKVVVGADRITRDGYVFNKIGTYQEAVLAKRHGIPFYPAAPASTFDTSRDHDAVEVEQRAYEEVVKVRGRRIAPRGIPVSNPAFDITPPKLVTAVVTDRGVVRQPLARSIGRMFGGRISRSR